MSELIQMYATSFLVLRLSDVTNRRFSSSVFFLTWTLYLRKHFTNFRYVVTLYDMKREQ